jgi:hypothetical protein
LWELGSDLEQLVSLQRLSLSVAPQLVRLWIPLELELLPQAFLRWPQPQALKWREVAPEEFAKAATTAVHGLQTNVQATGRELCA